MEKDKSDQTKQDKTQLKCPSTLEELKKFLGVEDTLPGSRENQERLLQWVQEKFKEQGDSYILP